MPDRQDDLNPASDLAPFADALQRLSPQPAHLSRDALLFEAGKAAAGDRLPRWAWPSATGFFAALSVVLAGFLITPATPAVMYVQQPAYPQNRELQPRPAADVPDSAAAALTKAPAWSARDADVASMGRVRRDVLRWGVDMLPESRPAGRGPSQDVAARELNHWLDLPPGTFASPGTQPKKPAAKDE